MRFALYIEVFPRVRFYAEKCDAKKEMYIKCIRKKDYSRP